MSSSCASSEMSAALVRVDQPRILEALVEKPPRRHGEGRMVILEQAQESPIVRHHLGGGGLALEQPKESGASVQSVVGHGWGQECDRPSLAACRSRDCFQDVRLRHAVDAELVSHVDALDALGNRTDPVLCFGLQVRVEVEDVVGDPVQLVQFARVSDMDG